MATHAPKRKRRSAEEREEVSRKDKKTRKASHKLQQPVKELDAAAQRQAELDKQEEEAKKTRPQVKSPPPSAKARPSPLHHVSATAPEPFFTMEEATDTSEDSSAEEDKKAGEPSAKKHMPRPRVFLTKSAMETLVNPSTHAYKLQPADLECSRQLRMFAIAARREKNSPYVKNGSIEVETADGKVYPLPINGRNAPRYPGAAALRGRVLLSSAQKAGVHAASSSFFKDFGFGAKTAIQLLKSSGQNVRDAEQEKKELHSLLDEGVKDLEIEPPSQIVD